MLTWRKKIVATRKGYYIFRSAKKFFSVGPFEEKKDRWDNSVYHRLNNIEKIKLNRLALEHFNLYGTNKRISVKELLKQLKDECSMSNRSL